MNMCQKNWINTHWKYESSIVKQLLETGHNIDPQTTFTVISHQTKPHLPVLQKLLQYSYKPGSRIQKEFVIGLHLPWG